VCALPVEVAQELVNGATANAVPSTRTGVPIADIAVVGLGVATTVITLAQGPSAFEDLARRLLRWRRRAEVRRDPTVSIDANGPGGRISLQLSRSTTEAELAAILGTIMQPADPAEETS